MVDPTREEPRLSDSLLEYYWGKDWPDDTYPEWWRYNDEQRDEIIELNDLIQSEITKAQEQLLDELEAKAPQRVFTTDLKGSRHAKVYSLAIDDFKTIIEAKRKAIKEGK